MAQIEISKILLVQSRAKFKGSMKVMYNNKSLKQ